MAPQSHSPSSLIPPHPRLHPHASQTLLTPLHPTHLLSCPTMDLLATVSTDHELVVYRLNGQRAFGLKRKAEGVDIDAVCWVGGGMGVAVAWSDGGVDVVGGEAGRVRTVAAGRREGKEELERVKCMGWGVNFIDVDAVKRRIGAKAPQLKDEEEEGKEEGETDIFGQWTTDDWDAVQDDTTLEDFLARQPDFAALDVAPDLPDHLAVMDVETVLPKLPPIPLPPALPFMRVQQSAAGAFSTPVEVDAALHAQHLKDHNAVDVFVRCSEDGGVFPTMYDSTETFEVRLPSRWGLESTPLLHTNHPYACTHMLLMRTHAPGFATFKIALVPLTLNFIPAAGIYLHLIASKTSQLQNLISYTAQTLSRMQTFASHARDLPSRFTNSISESLAEDRQGDLVTQLYHAVCTGNCTIAIREWLINELTEAGHKRWDTTVTTSLTTLLSITHENLIPALDRLTVILLRLRGLAAFHDRSWIFAAPPTQFTALLDIVRKLRLQAHTLLIRAAEEKRAFEQFSKWLRHTIDYESTEEAAARAEAENRDAGVDIPLVLSYIESALTQAPLDLLLGPAEKGLKTQSYEAVRDSVVESRTGGDGGGALNLAGSFAALREGVGEVLGQVSGWLRAGVGMEGGVVLEEWEGGKGEEEEVVVVDVRMVFSPTPTHPNAITTHSLLSTPPVSIESTLHIHHLTHAPRLASLPADIHNYAVTSYPLSTISPGAKILDAKFVDDTDVMVLLRLPAQNIDDRTTKAKAEHRLIRFPLSPTSISSPSLAPPLLPSSSPTPQASRTTPSLAQSFIQDHTKHIFEPRFTPLKFVVNGRKDRRTVVVLGSDKRHYRVLDLDYSEGEGKEVEGDGDGDEDVGM